MVSFSKSFLIFIPLSVYLLALIILCLCSCYIPLCDFKISDDEDGFNLFPCLGLKSVKECLCVCVCVCVCAAGGLNCTADQAPENQA